MRFPTLISRGALLLTSLAFGMSAMAGEIALTFDDAPMPDSVVMSGVERTETLIRGLQSAGVKGALFFSTTKHIDPAGRKRLQRYAKSGFHLAHHSHSHRSADELSVEEYMEDFHVADEILRRYDNFLPIHRFPYLHHGRDAEHAKALQAAISNAGYSDGYVTIDTADWYLNHLMTQAKEEGHSVDTDAMKRLYVDTLWDTIRFYDEMAKRTLGRSPRHVLLLHENDAAALFIADLVARIADEGWSIVSAQKAYEDPIAQSFPKGGFHKQGRIAALAYQAGTPLERLKSPFEDLEFLEAQFQSVITRAP